MQCINIPPDGNLQVVTDLARHVHLHHDDVKCFVKEPLELRVAEHVVAGVERLDQDVSERRGAFYSVFQNVAEGKKE
jgi:hypothetical protein